MTASPTNFTCILTNASLANFTCNLTDMAKHSTGFTGINASYMLALIPVILASLTSDMPTLLRLAHDRPFLRWTLALTCTRPLAVWRDNVHLDEILEEPNEPKFNKTSVLVQRLAASNSLCNRHVVTILGNIERAKFYSNFGYGLPALLLVISIYVGMMVAAYEFAKEYSHFSAKLSWAIFFSQILTGCFSTWDRRLSDASKQRQTHYDRFCAKVRYEHRCDAGHAEQHPLRCLFSRHLFGRTPQVYPEGPRVGEEAGGALQPEALEPHGFFHCLNARLILRFPKLMGVSDPDIVHDEDSQKSDIEIQAKIAGWTSSFSVPFDEVKETLKPSTAKFTTYRYTFTNMARMKPGWRTIGGIATRVFRWMRLEWIFILGQLTAWGAIVGDSLQASLAIGLTQVIGTALMLAGVYWITLGYDFKTDRILAAFRLADPEIERDVYLLPHELAKDIWNGLSKVFLAAQARKRGDGAAPTQAAYEKIVDDVLQAFISQYGKEESIRAIQANSDTEKTCVYFVRLLMNAHSDPGEMTDPVGYGISEVKFDPPATLTQEITLTCTLHSLHNPQAQPHLQVQSPQLQLQPAPPQQPQPDRGDDETGSLSGVPSPYFRPGTVVPGNKSGSVTLSRRSSQLDFRGGTRAPPPPTGPAISAQDEGSVGTTSGASDEPRAPFDQYPYSSSNSHLPSVFPPSRSRSPAPTSASTSNATGHLSRSSTDHSIAASRLKFPSPVSSFLGNHSDIRQTLSAQHPRIDAPSSPVAGPSGAAHSTTSSQGDLSSLSETTGAEEEQEVESEVGSGSSDANQRTVATIWNRSGAPPLLTIQSGETLGTSFDAFNYQLQVPPPSDQDLNSLTTTPINTTTPTPSPTPTVNAPSRRSSIRSRTTLGSVSEHDPTELRTAPTSPVPSRSPSPAQSQGHDQLLVPSSHPEDQNDNLRPPTFD